MWKVLPKKRRIKQEGTPRFLYLLAFLAFSSWGGWGYLLLFTSPTKLETQLLFLGVFSLALLFTLTFLFWEVASLFIREEPRQLFYSTFRRAFFIAFFLGFGGTLKLLKLANPFNLALFALILLLTEIHLSRR